MDTLLKNVKETVRGYVGSGRGFNVQLYPLLDDENQHYGIAAVGYPERKRPMSVMVMARVVDGQVIIEEDRTDRPLVDELIAAGIPRERIVLAYIGEAPPATET
jgi:hypothetical protein